MQLAGRGTGILGIRVSGQGKTSCVRRRKWKLKPDVEGSDSESRDRASDRIRAVPGICMYRYRKTLHHRKPIPDILWGRMPIRSAWKDICLQTAAASSGLVHCRTDRSLPPFSRDVCRIDQNAIVVFPINRRDVECPAAHIGRRLSHPVILTSSVAPSYRCPRTPRSNAIALTGTVAASSMSLRVL